MLYAVIFDMDGVLVDSEPSWRAAEVEVLRSLGVPMTDAMCRETTGLRIDEVVAFWRARFPWEGPENAVVADRIVDGLIARLGPELALPGGHKAVALVRERRLNVALASSSPMRLIRETLRILDLASFSVLASAEEEARGKPDPAVYLTAARRLGVKPEECLAIEDSINGVRSAISAGMSCLAVPEAGTDLRRIEEAGREGPGIFHGFGWERLPDILSKLQTPEVFP